MEFKIALETVVARSLEDEAADFHEHFDGVLVERDGRVIVTVYIEAPSAVEAAHTAIRELEANLAFSIVRVDQDLVDATEIALRADVTREAVRLWAVGARGQSFPFPAGSPGGKRIWAWGEVATWLRDHQDDFDEPPTLTLDESVVVDHHLAQRRQQVSASRFVTHAGHSKSQTWCEGVDSYSPRPRVSFMATS